MNEPLAVMEGLLFLSGDDGVKLTDLAETLDLNESACKKLLKALNNKYHLDTDCALQVKFFNHSYHLVTKPKYWKYFQKLFNKKTELFLTNASYEVLAIIAYYGPITRSQIEKFRGVNSDGVVVNLLAKDLIESIGRASTVGKPHLYAVSETFVKVFQLKSKKDLPVITNQDLSTENLGEMFTNEQQAESKS